MLFLVMIPFFTNMYVRTLVDIYISTASFLENTFAILATFLKEYIQKQMIPFLKALIKNLLNEEKIGPGIILRMAMHAPLTLKKVCFTT